MVSGSHGFDVMIYGSIIYILSIYFGVAALLRRSCRRRLYRPLGHKVAVGRGKGTALVHFTLYYFSSSISFLPLAFFFTPTSIISRLPTNLLPPRSNRGLSIGRRPPP